MVAAAARPQRVVVRHRAAAARLHGEGRRQDAPRRLGRDDGGRLVRLRRRDRRADLPARQGDRPRRAPDAQARQAGRRLPVLDRRPQLLARLVRPADNYIYNAAAETAAVLVAGSSRRRRRSASVLAGDVFLGLANGNFGQYLRAAGRTTARSARSTSRPASGLEVRRRPSRSAAASRRPRPASASPAAATASCARSTRRPARCSGRSRPATRSRPGPSIYSVDGKEYVAITVGGTPTSSAGGTGDPKLQVFALGGPSGYRAPAAARPARRGDDRADRRPRRRARRARRGAGQAARVRAARLGRAHRHRGPRTSSAPWHGDRRQRADRDRPPLPGQPPGAGRADARRHATRCRRRPTRTARSATAPTSPSRAATSSPSSTADKRQGRRAARSDRRPAGGGKARARRLQRRLRALRRRTKKTPGGRILVSGRVDRPATATPPPPVVLYTYRLTRHDHRRERQSRAGRRRRHAHRRPRLLDVLRAERRAGHYSRSSPRRTSGRRPGADGGAASPSATRRTAA